MIQSMPRRDPFFMRSALVVLAAVGLAMFLGRFLATHDLATLRAAAILSGLLAISLVLFFVICRADPDGRILYTLLLVSFVAKLGALWFRFYIRLLADAFQYHNTGRIVAEILASGQWPEDAGFTGTRFIRLLTGVFYLTFGETMYGAAITWAWCGLLGLLFFFRAFTTAFPGGDRRLYMWLVLLYPSLLLWTSSLGKDALMVMFIGMSAFGNARLQRSIEPVGIFWLALGLTGQMMIRPHVAAVTATAVMASFIFRPIHAGLMSPVIRLGGFLAIAVAAAFIITSAQSYVGLESLEVESIVGYIEEQQEHSEQGGSAFQQVDISTPQGLLLAIPTVLFRPWPWEAPNTGAMVTAMEGMALLSLIVYRWRSVRAALGALFRNSYILYTVVYAALFVFFFSAIGNFGIIARQRVQLLPFILMWIAYLGTRRATAPAQEGRPA
jgi:hypothetical protein